DDVARLRGRKGDGQGIRLIVDGETDEVYVRAFGHGEGIEAGNGERACDLARAVGAEVEEDNGVAVLNRRNGFTAFACDDDGFDKLVGHAALVRSFDRRDGIGRAFAFAVDQHLVSAFGAFPTLVSIHRVVAPADRRDLADADLSAFVAHLCDVTNGGRGRRVAPVEEAMDEDTV